MDNPFLHWLAGFIDGEGCFMIDRHPDGGRHRTMFKLRLRDDDKAILDEIVKRTKLGVVTPMSRKNYLIGRRCPQSIWVVYSKDDCLGLVNILDHYPLRAKKKRDYQIWRKAVFVWTEIDKYRNGRNGPHPLQKVIGNLKRDLESGKKHPSYRI